MFLPLYCFSVSSVCLMSVSRLKPDVSIPLGISAQPIWKCNFPNGLCKHQINGGISLCSSDQHNGPLFRQICVRQSSIILIFLCPSSLNHSHSNDVRLKPKVALEAQKKEMKQWKLSSYSLRSHINTHFTFYRTCSAALIKCNQFFKVSEPVELETSETIMVDFNRNPFSYE